MRAFIWSQPGFGPLTQATDKEGLSRDPRSDRIAARFTVFRNPHAAEHQHD